MRTLVFMVYATAAMWAADVLEVKHAAKDVALSADASSRFWKEAKAVVATKDNLGVAHAGHETQIRARWTTDNLYVLMSCPYKEMYLIEAPERVKETNRLWQHDVAEIFIGADFENIHRYREYQVSPQSEWVDLDIDRKNPLPEGGWKWDSGMKVLARVDEKAKVWYGEFQIPLKSITGKPIAPGSTMRGNFFRFQGPPASKVAVAWMPTGKANNHMPEMFGKIEFVK